ncbi:sensor domain-containing diguanylate cyclase [Dyella mobilis]|uniref:diguanylate cyclase n=1 Tax=Dyella mobilis TaxID=1849582 RepID=A0ABS2KFH2_9GAMM|nr:sensor domain-containing diguanylate cyclase [Dyella mobilis]MBM7129907.1 sensor domain-containing diguanylate cyclase [Dyella mobilis]GLQ97830.1 diguanylate cyclase [Dyella mobilis]
MFLDMNGETLERLHAVIRAHPQWQWETDRNWRFTKVAEPLLQLLGRERESVLGQPVYAFMQAAEAVRAARFLHARPGAPFACVISRHVHADGSTLALESDAVPLRDEAGHWQGYRGISQGVVDVDLAQSESVFRMLAVYDNAPSALSLIGRDGRYLTANAAYASLYGVSPEDLVGRKVDAFMHGAGERLRRNFKQLDAGEQVPAREIALGDKFYQVLANPVHNLMGQVVAITTALMDITDRKQAEQKLEEANRKLQHYAKNDHLTGLPNRREVDEVLAAEVHRAMRADHPLSVLMIDVDVFKKYNDSYGHLRGDECVRAVAAELKKTVHRHDDLVGRYGGDEFVAILPGTDAIGALKVAGAIVHAIRALNIPHAQSQYGKVTLSIGAATLACVPYAQDVQEQCDALLQTADRALYAAKLSGRNAAHGMSAAVPRRDLVS